MPRDRGANPLLIVTLVVIAAAAFVLDTALMQGMVGPLRMNDFGKFYYSTRAFLQGTDMYAPNPATDLHFPEAPDLRFLNMNPPHFHLLVLPFAWLPPRAAVLLWVGVSLAALAVAILLISRELGLAWTPLRILATVAGVLAFAGTQTFFATGQLTLLLTLAITIAWLHARHNRWLIAAAWLGACLSVKPFLLVFAPYLLLSRRFRALAIMLAVAASIFAIGLVSFGADAYRSWLGALAQSDDWAWTVMNGSTFGFFSRAFSVQPIVAPVIVAPQVMMLWPVAAGIVGLVTLWLTVRDPAPAATDRTFALLLTSAQLMSPLGWVYYAWLMAGPVAGAIAQRGLPRGAARALAVIACVGYLWPLPLLTAFQPNPWATFFIASIYFWARLSMWLWLVVDAVHFTPSTNTTAAVSGG